MSLHPWFPFPCSLSSPKVRLFCFSHSGGVASHFRHWQTIFSPQIEVCPVQLPGREDRFKEPLIRSMAPLIDELWPHILTRLDRPVAFFGHSLGALIAYELVKRGQKECKSIPMTLFVSACLPPHRLEVRTPIHQLPDPEFIQHIEQHGGMAKELLENSSAMEMLLPRLRADLTLFESFREDSSSPLDIPLIAFGGREDPVVPHDTLQEWKKYSSAFFATHLFLGGHFYHFTTKEELSKIITKYLMQYVG